MTPQVMALQDRNGCLVIDQSVMSGLVRDVVDMVVMERSVFGVADGDRPSCSHHAA